MKKRIASAVLALLMLGSFVACGDSGSSSAAAGGASEAAGGSANVAAGEKTVVEIWSEDRHDADYVTAMIDQFNETNESGIEIQLTIISDDYANMVSLAFSSGTAPDLVSFHSDFPNMINTGMFRPLTSYVEAAGEEFEKTTAISEHMFEGLNVFGGEIYAVPLAVRSGLRVIYNEDHVEEAGYSAIPSTIGEFVDLSKAITANGAGEYYGYAATSSSPFVRLLQGVAELSGVNQYGYDYVNGVFDFSGWKEVLEAFAPLLGSDSLFPGSATQGVDAMRAQFADGTVGLWANASQEAGVFTEQFPVEGFEWGVSMLPTLDGTIKGALSSTPSKSFMMMSSTQNPDAAWEVYEFLASEEFLKGYFENGYALPYSDYMAGVVDTASAGRISDFQLTQYESVYPVAPLVTVEGDIAQVVLWDAAMGLIDIDAAIEDLNTRYNAALERDLADGKVQRVVIEDYNAMEPNGGTIQYLDD